MQRTQISTQKAPGAIGPYSQAIRVGQFIYTSGQVALDPDSGQLVGDDVQSQTARALQNLQAVLAAAGVSLEHVVKTTVFLTTMDNFQAMNTVYARYFEAAQKHGALPARSTVAVAGLPRNALVEIECVAVVES